MPESLMGPNSEAIRINGKAPVNKALMPVQIWYQRSPKKDLLMVAWSMVLDNSCAWAHFSWGTKCICFHSTTENLACVPGFLADVESRSEADDVSATICPWATAKQQVQEEHMPDSHQQKELRGGLSGTAWEVHAPLFFWHQGIVVSLHQAKQMTYKFNFQLCNNSYHKYRGTIVQENFSCKTTWVFKNHSILLLKLNAHKKIMMEIRNLSCPKLFPTHPRTWKVSTYLFF